MRCPLVPDSIVIDSRFNGPPDSANGGYTCGLLAAAIDGPAEVTLRAPPPLRRELRVEAGAGRDQGAEPGSDDGVRLLDGDRLVAEATAVDPDWSVPPPVPLDDARAAIAGSHFLQLPRPFETCFVCGPSREAHDGLEIYPGPVDGRDALHAGTWIPDASDAGDDGRVLDEIVWASLDCPTSSPVANRPGPDGTLRPIVLARLAVDARAPIAPGVEYVVTAWPIAVDGRKRHSGAALFTRDGDLLASSRALWIELRAD
ncbi:MAG TPA: hypothetical protein VJT75_00255 [Thermoleophilaceae bacterium]|nr:hypothetical protein [Thermoleophilaceae bacterium]